MLHTSEPVPSNTLNSNVEKKSHPISTVNVTNSTDLTSIAVTSPSTPLRNSNDENNDETLPCETRQSSHSEETKPTDRTTRKECYRLGRRKLLFEKRRKASDYALFFAMMGLLLMVLEQELTMAQVYTKVKRKHI